MVQEGKHIAKISDYGVKETKDGRPYVAIYFHVDGQQGDVQWNGHLTEKTIERTMKTLATCGLTGDFMAVADGPISGALNMQVEVQIEVELKPGLKDPTKKFASVKWVNAIGGAKFDAAVSASAKSKLSQYAGNWAKVRGELGVKKAAPAVGF